MQRSVVNKIRAITSAQRKQENLRLAGQNDLQNKRKFVTERAIAPAIKMEKTIGDLQQEIKQMLEYGRL